MRWPAAALLGSLFLLGILNLCSVKLPFYKTSVSFFSKVMSSVLTGLALYLMAGDKLSLMTYLASSSAGGIAGMSIFAMSVGADVGIVAFFQSVRILVLYVSLPFTTGWLARHASGGALPAVPETAKTAKPTFTAFEIIRFAAVTCAAALAFETVNVPSGFMLGAMCGAGAVNLCSGKVMPLPPRLKNAAQICLGITITAGLSPRTVVLLTELCLPLIVSVSMIQFFSLGLAYIMRKITHWDIMTSVLATCPGGLSQVVFFAEDLNADPFICGVFHAVRMISIVLFVPFAARLFA